jgi:hypothetical protein
MKKILILGLATLVVAGFVWVAKNWADVQADYWLLRTDWAISRTKSWRMRLQPTDAKLPKESDHLPYHLTTSGGWADATCEWNPKVSIDAPNSVFDRPKDFHY